jgi:cysteine desulfurase
VEKLGVDLMSLGAHKFHGPKGVGALYVRQGVPLVSVLTGGSQENARRAGTENVPYIVGMAKALELAQSAREVENARLRKMRDRLVRGLLAALPGIEMTGDSENRLPGHASFVVPGVIGDEMIVGLDLAGIAASTGSACNAASLEPSHVLAALGYPPDRARGALRLTLGRENTDDEIDYALEVIPDVIARRRPR